MSESREFTPAGLERRVPQGSEQAQLDRRMSWSGRIMPLPEPCRDFQLIERLYERLNHL